MGSDKKSKKRPSTESDDEGKRKKHRTRDDKEKKSSKNKKKENLKSKKSHKHSKHHRAEGKKLEEKRDHKHHKHDHHSELSSDDYYSKNNEFATWLKEERGLFFSDLSSESARELFTQFIKDWNNQKLDSRYYEGISSGPRTAHNWKLVDKK